MESKVKYFKHGDEVKITNIWLDEWGRVIIHIYYQSDSFECDCYYDEIEIVEVSECSGF